MLGQHLRRWASINPTGQRVVFAGMPVCPAVWRMRIGYQHVVHTLQAHCNCLVKTKGSICLLYKWAGTTWGQRIVVVCTGIYYLLFLYPTETQQKRDILWYGLMLAQVSRYCLDVDSGISSFTESGMALQYRTDPDIMHAIGRDDFLDQWCARDLVQPHWHCTVSMTRVCRPCWNIQRCEWPRCCVCDWSGKAISSNGAPKM